MVGPDIMRVDIEDIYLLIRLSSQEGPMVLNGVRII